jgi:hypothetical protein
MDELLTKEQRKSPRESTRRTSERSYINAKLSEEERQKKAVSEVRQDDDDVRDTSSPDETTLQTMKGTIVTTQATLHKDLSSNLEDEV